MKITIKIQNHDIINPRDEKSFSFLSKYFESNPIDLKYLPQVGMKMRLDSFINDKSIDDYFVRHREFLITDVVISKNKIDVYV